MFAANQPTRTRSMFADKQELIGSGHQGGVRLRLVIGPWLPSCGCNQLIRVDLIMLSVWGPTMMVVSDRSRALGHRSWARGPGRRCWSPRAQVLGEGARQALL